MAKFGFINRTDRVIAILRGALKDPTLLRSLSDFLRTRIYQYTKRGYSLGSLKTTTRRGNIGDPRKLKPLSESYIEYRKGLRKSGKTKSTKLLRKAGLKKFANNLEMRKFGEFFSPARSNLTLTGQMLDALKADIDQNSGQAIVYVDDTSRKDSDLTNKQVAEKVAQDGRPFMGIDRVGRDRIRRTAQAFVRRKLKRR